MRTSQMACTGGAVVALLLTLAAPAAAQEAETVTVDGTVVGAHWIDETSPACDLPETTWRFYSAGTGQLAGLGEVEYFLTHCTMFDAESGGADSTYYHRTITLTTAEGDTLAIVPDYTSTVVYVDDAGAFTGFDLIGTWDAVGGTGRFTYATGNGSMAGSAAIPGDLVIELDGDIAYGAPAQPE